MLFIWRHQVCQCIFSVIIVFTYLLLVHIYDLFICEILYQILYLSKSW